MKDYDNSSFYNSKKWKQVSTAYMTSRSYICERCGRPATICHHRKHLDGNNVNDLKISLGFDNLEALCQDCHNKEHFASHQLSTALFDRDGNMIGVKKSEEEKQFENDQKKIDLLLQNIAQNRSESLSNGEQV